MIRVIHGIREQHHCPTPEAFAKHHAGKIAERALRGARITISENHAPLVASINHGRWVARCDCGAGVAVEPTWEQARCFGCGTVHCRIVLPADREAIEAVLLRRKQDAHRHWVPGVDTLDRLRAENQAHPERLRA